MGTTMRGREREREGEREGERERERERERKRKREREREKTKTGTPPYLFLKKIVSLRIKTGTEDLFRKDSPSWTALEWSGRCKIRSFGEQLHHLGL